MNRSRILGRAAAGLFAGVVAGLAMLVMMLVLRSVLGISPPAEMIPDRFAPTLTIEQFFDLIGQFGGYNELKQFGVGSITVGQLVVGALLGLAFGLVAGSPSRGRLLGQRRSTLIVGVAILLLWVVTLTVVWPVLDTSFIGLPPDVAAPVTALGLLVSYATYGVVLVLAYQQLVSSPSPKGRDAAAPNIGRRAMLVTGIGAALAVASGALGRRLWTLASFAYDGTRFWGPLTPITPNNLFYVVTKNVVDPGVEQSVWRLEIGGHVQRPHTYTFSEITSLARVVQETTLMCISNGVGDALMSNAQWTGVPLATLLEAAGPRPGGVEALLRGADGYTDTIPLEKALDPATLVVFEMNGDPLPRIHGYPVRLIVPGMYGEKNVKWVTSIELVTQDVKGFYEQQGWGPDFVIPIRSRFYEPDGSQPARVGEPVAMRGIVFGGDRGVSRAEVSLDGGQSWRKAPLEYQGSPYAWAIWNFQFTPEIAGEYYLAVRGYDAAGTPQPSEDRGIVPTGARGYHHITVNVVA
ncbi:MAG: molybdopterin-dependent oxidoreductase [Chloroflexota bacterium]